jgi:hypothetical protein
MLPSVKMCSRSKLPPVKNSVGQNGLRSKIPSVKNSVGQNSRRSKLLSVKNAVGQNGRRSKWPSVKAASVKRPGTSLIMTKINYFWTIFLNWRRTQSYFKAQKILQKISLKISFS